ncbi:MAG: ribonucleotide reductase N-terminal alpha domain-containing protein, partial [Ktedonobacterales bacterium]
MKDKKSGAGEMSAATAAKTATSVKRKSGEWSEAALRVLRERYLLKDAEGKLIETPDEMCWRVASAVA